MKRALLPRITRRLVRWVIVLHLHVLAAEERKEARITKRYEDARKAARAAWIAAMDRCDDQGVRNITLSKAVADERKKYS